MLRDIYRAIMWVIAGHRRVAESRRSELRNRERCLREVEKAMGWTVSVAAVLLLGGGCAGNGSAQEPTVQPSVEEKVQCDRVGIEEVEAVLRMYVDFGRENRIYFTDDVYELPNLKDVQVFLDEDWTDRNLFIVNDYDCEDFAFELLGKFSTPYFAPLAVGLALSGAPYWHFFNVVICQDRKLYIIEPQNDYICPIEDAGECYQPTLVIM